MGLREWSVRAIYAAMLAGIAVVPWLATARTPAEAATLTVTKTADTADGVCDADCSLREAINAAVSGDTVSVPAGTYTLAIVGANEDAGASGDLDVLVNLTIAGAGSGSTIIDGNDLDRVLDVAGAVDLDLQGLTVRDGTAPAGTWGGGIQSVSGALTLDDVDVSSNVSTSWGGGIYAGGSLVLTNSSVSGNGADQGGGIVTFDLTMTDSNVDNNTTTDQGGGIWACCGNASFNITSSTVDDNTAADQGGGIFHCCGALELVVDDSSVSGNTSADQGGGIFYCCGDVVEATTIVITGSTIDGNTSASQGGGVFSCCDNGAPITITIADTAITNNAATSDGGGLYDCCGSALTSIFDSVISGNDAGSAEFSSVGGGIYSDANELVIMNTTISGNTVFGEGGGIYNESTDALIAQSTISGNTATSSEAGGGGIYNTEVMRLANSTVSGNATDLNGGGIFNNFELDIDHATIAGNTAGDAGDQIYNDGSIAVTNSIVAGSGDNCAGEGDVGITSLGNSIDSGATCEFDNPGDMQNTDPLLGSLADNGGPTLTRALLAGSPAIDAADSEFCIEVDQREVVRPVGAACDIGAFEGVSEGAEPTATPTATPVPPEGGGGGDITAPRFEATQAPAPQPTSAPASPVAPVATATQPVGGAGAGVIAPDAGTGPGGGGDAMSWWIAALAAAAGVTAGAGIVVRRARR